MTASLPQELLDNYNKTIPDKLKALAALIQESQEKPSQENLAALRALVHKMIGNTLVFGYVDASQCCRDFEQRIKQLEAAGEKAPDLKEFNAYLKKITLALKSSSSEEKTLEELSDEPHKDKILTSLDNDLERFIYIASHDLQEPLNFLQQHLQILESRLSKTLSAEDSKLMEKIMHANERMSSLIQDLLSYSRLGRNKNLSTIDCNSLIDEILISLNSLIESSGAKIVIQKQLPTIKSYHEEFKVLLQHLIDNAIKFAKKDEVAEVTINCQDNHKEWLFSVTDKGIGIKDKYINRLFHIFQRLHNHDEYPGNGIGLANAKKIIDLHQGKIWIESKPEEGTTVWFTIPKM